MPSLLTPAWSLRLDISRLIVAAVLGGALLAGCGAAGSGGTPSSPPGDADAIEVVASTTVLADLVRQVGGSHVNVASLVPPGGEVHTFDPTPADIARVADADLVVMNGLGLDEWVADLATASGSDAPIVRLGEEIDGATDNPHLWMDVRNATRYAVRIGDELSRVDAANAASYENQVRAYTERLTELDSWAREQLAAIPAERRKVVSFHDALPSFAEAYGLEIVGTIVDAPGQDPSAGEIAGLIDEIRASGATALFGEAQFNPELARTIAEEAGITVVTDLSTDSLGDAPADTYEGMIRSDVEKVVEALRA
ncbi:MAG TPA: metal ABC transporter substrate-binding protein [Candidatus Limnocylindrales bacterium]|nr:metal ABC transporter substrate-binding protein [Candidatus Limnocylindrales bacterium]